MRHTTKVIRAALAGAVLAGTLVATAAPSQASAGGIDLGGCDVGYFCVFTDAHFKNHRADFTVGSVDLRNSVGGFVFDEQISSYVNRTDDTWCVYSKPGCEGLLDRVAPGGRREDLSIDKKNDQISSLRVC